ENAGIASELPAAIEQIPRDVAEDHPAALADAVQRSERDQTVAATDVEHRVAGGERGVVEHPVADGTEVLHRGRESPAVTSVPALEQPRGPLVPGRCAHTFIVPRP